jgi:hypothetical protein
MAALGPVGEELLFACVAAEADGPLASLRGSLALQRSLRRCFLTLTQADLSPVSLSRLADRLSARGEPAASRVAELARLYQRYRSLLSASGAKLDSGLALVRRVQALADEPQAALAALGLSAAFASDGNLAIVGLHRLPTWDGLPTFHAALHAFSTLFAESSGRGAALLLPALLDADTADGTPAVLDAALKPILEPIYERHALRVEIDWQPLGPAVAGPLSETPWARFVRGLFRPANAAPLLQGGELPVDQLSITALPSPADEARTVARRVHDLIARGTPPGEIAVLVEDPARKTRVEVALRRYGVPVQRPVDARSFADVGGRAELPPPLALPLSLYDLLQQGLPREGLLSVITSSYVRLPLPEEAADATHLARALRGAGVRALSGCSRDELRRRIREWLRLQSSKSRKLAGAISVDAAQLRDDPTLPVELQQLAVLLDELEALPVDGTIRHHAQALLRLCERLRLIEQAQGVHSPLPAQQGWAAVDAHEAMVVAALARDQAAAAVLRRLLHELPTRADALRVAELRLSRERFAALLRALCLRLWAEVARQAKPATQAVQLAGLFDLPVRPRAQLFCVGLIEGEQPGSLPEDPLLSDDDRKLCNHLLGLAVFPLSRHLGDAAALRWVELLAHSQAAHLSYPRADEEGRPLLSSSFVAAALHAAGREGHEATADALPTSRIPPPQLARHPSELWLHAAPALSSTETAAESARALASALTRQERERRVRLAARLHVEQARVQWFSSLAQLDGDPVGPSLISDGFSGPAQALAPAGPYCGQLTSARLIAALSARLPGSAKRPLSASALEDYARCPFRFFVYRVLHAAPIEEGGDDLDPLTSGRLHHRVLEKFFAALRDQGRLPLRGDEAERTLLLRVIDEVLVEFDESERTGHPTLFRARLRRLRSDLLQLIAREAQEPIEPGCLPTLLEHPFGPLRIAAQDDVGHRERARNSEAIDGTGDEFADGTADRALHIAGIIDRIDIGPGRALVLDYKTGQIRRYQDYLRGQLLVTSFQLPLYAAAVQADPQVQALARTLAASQHTVDAEASHGDDGASSPLQVSARYYAVRQAQVSAALQEEGLFALSGPARRQAGEHNVAEVSYHLWRRLRGGDFRVAPKTCEGCGVEAVCRIGTAAIDRVVVSEAGESEQTSGVTPSRRSGRSPSASSAGSMEEL